jgi:hypothetical protein
MRRKAIYSGMLCFFVLMLSDCAPHYLNANFDPPSVQRIHGIGKPIPLKVGIYVSPESKQYKARALIPFGGWNYNFGDHLENVIFKSMLQVFDVVRIAHSPNARSGDFDLVIEPKFDNAQTKIIMTITKVDVAAAVTYNISDRDGVFWRETFKGKIQTGGHIKSMKKQGQPLAMQAEQAAQRIWADFSNPERINSLLAKRAGGAPSRVARTRAPSALAQAQSPASTTPAARSDVDLDIPVSGARNPDAVAVVIGNRDYRSSDIPSVDFALNDAKTVKKYLVSVLGYDEGNIIYIENATKAQLESVFGSSYNHRGRLYNYLKKGRSDIFVFYSGHGAPDPVTKQGFFVPSDVDPQTIGITGYPLKQLYDNIAKISNETAPPNVFIVIDACFSGATEKGLLLKNVSPLTITVSTPLMKMPNAVVLSASGGEQVSSWYPDKGHGMFTYFFLKALKREAERKSSLATAGGVFSSVADDNEGVPYFARRLHGRMQNPQIMGDSSRLFFRVGD